MINHIRTLLLYQRPEAVANTCLDGYIDPGFVPLALPDDLETARRVILAPSDMAADPQLFHAAAVLGSWLRCAHMQDLRAYARALDARLTYDPADAGMRRLPRVAVDTVDPTDTLGTRYVVVGDLRRSETYDIRGYGDTLTISTPGAADRTQRVAFSAGGPQLVYLQDTAIRLFITASSREFPTTARIRVRTFAHDLWELSARLLRHGDKSTSLFAGGGRHAAALQGLRAVMLDAPTMPVRLGAYALAVALKIDDARGGL